MHVNRGRSAVELAPELLPHIFTKVEVASGDGGVGTILQLTFSQGEIDSESKPLNT
jgi:hypothetical protein